jgi:adenine-specific DNA-methyltransferase
LASFLKGQINLATGTPRTRWNGNLAHPFPDNIESSLALHLSYAGKVAESDVLAIEPATLQPLQIKEGNANTLYYGDNPPILAALMQNPEIKGKVRLIYIDPPFATNSVFQSRTQGDAYHDLLVGAHYIEFLRARLIFLRELLAKDGSIYIHLDENMAFHIKVIMDELFGKGNFRNWITRKKCNPKKLHT